MICSVDSPFLRLELGSSPSSSPLTFFTVVLGSKHEPFKHVHMSRTPLAFKHANTMVPKALSFLCSPLQIPSTVSALASTPAHFPFQSVRDVWQAVHTYSRAPVVKEMAVFMAVHEGVSFMLAIAFTLDSGVCLSFRRVQSFLTRFKLCVLA